MQTKLKIAIFLIDDDSSMRQMLESLLSEGGFINYTIYSDPVKLLEDLHNGVQVCVIDYNLKHETYDGLVLMQEILERNSYCKCIVMTGYEDVESIKCFLNAGAFRYITKAEPAFSKKLTQYIKDAIELISQTYNFYKTVLEQMRDATQQLKAVKNG